MRCAYTFSSILALLFIVTFLSGAQATEPDTAYARIMKNGVIRCGYGIWPPMMIKDPNTDKITGIFPELMEAAFARMDIRVDWAEDLGWSAFIEALKTNRVDAMCANIFPESNRGKHIDFSIPSYYLGRGVYVRADDTRFDDGNLEILNTPDITFATLDGDNVIVTQEHFPKARQITLPQLTDSAQMLTNVVTKKADAVVVNTYTGEDFIAKNPGSLKRIAPNIFLEVYGSTVAFNKGEEKLKSMINIAFTEILNNGTVERILKKYDRYPGTFLRVAKPYTSNKP